MFRQKGMQTHTGDREEILKQEERAEINEKGQKETESRGRKEQVQRDHSRYMYDDRDIHRHSHSSKNP